MEEDLRKERLDVDRTQDHLAATRDGATPGQESVRNAGRGAKSLGDRAADAIDDVKDRVDGDPASRPGRDATDRPGR